MHAYLRSLALGLALLLPAVPAFAADAPAKTDAAIPDKPPAAPMPPAAPAEKPATAERSAQDEPTQADEDEVRTMSLDDLLDDIHNM